MVFVLQVSAILSIFVTAIEGWLPEAPAAPLALVLEAALALEPESFALLIVPVARISCPMCEFNFDESAPAGS